MRLVLHVLWHRVRRCRLRRRARANSRVLGTLRVLDAQARARVRVRVRRLGRARGLGMLGAARRQARPTLRPARMLRLLRRRRTRTQQLVARMLALL